MLIWYSPKAALIEVKRDAGTAAGLQEHLIKTSQNLERFTSVRGESQAKLWDLRSWWF